MTVVDGFADGAGQLRVSLLGIPVQTQYGLETNVGEAMRYLAELAWAPPAIAANRQLEWRDVDERTIEVECGVAAARAAVHWQFNDAGDLVRATGLRPFPVGKTFVPRRWGGDFGEYADFAGTRMPSSGEAWWELPEGRFVYWRGRITALEFLGAEAYHGDGCHLDADSVRPRDPRPRPASAPGLPQARGARCVRLPLRSTRGSARGRVDRLGAEEVAGTGDRALLDQI